VNVNRHQDPRSKREEEFQANVQAVRQNPETAKTASPEVLEAAKNQANFSANRKKYGL
jgi:hypothetical protein